ncbi:hypothetical protein BDV93DRAFT_34724 [Ceratobasidium sp. AG-I]|nr:hypothetical protein BDV93DRAFT_34724 [Ceratobasidium sp. AG-I]
MSTTDGFSLVKQQGIPKSDLPLEIILNILEHSISCETWHSRSIQLNRTLLISHTVYTTLLKLAYSTVILKSAVVVHLFLDTLTTSPHLASFVINLWVADSQLHPFEVLDDLRGVIETKLPAIIAATSNLKRIAVPYAYFPRSGLPGIVHLSTTNNLFPPTTPFLHSVKTLYIDGVPDRDCVNTIISRFGNVQHVVISVHPGSEDISNEAFICARMMKTFTNQLKSLVELEMNVETTVSEVLRMGMKRTLEKDPRIQIRERNWQLEREAGPLLCDEWMKESENFTR